MNSVVSVFKKYLLSGFFWSVASTLAMQGAVLLTGVVLARVLGIELYGVYVIATTTVMTVTGLVQGGIGLTSTKFVGEWLNNQPDKVSRVLKMCSGFTAIVGTVAALFLISFSSIITEKILNKPQMNENFIMVSIAVVFHVMMVYQQGALQGFGEFKKISYASLMSGCVQFFLSCLGAYFYGLDGALLAFLVSAFVRWLLFKIILIDVMKKFNINNNVKIQPGDWAVLRTFMLPAGMASLVTLPCIWGVTMLIARQPGGVTWVALFSVANQIRQMILQFPAMLNSVTFAALSKLKGSDENDKFHQVFKTNMMIGVAIVFFELVLFLLGRDYVLGIYGEDFLQARDLLVILTISTIPEIISMSLYQLIQSHGAMWRSLFLIMGPRDIIYLMTSIAMLPAYGLSGVGASYLMAHLFALLSTWLIGRSVSK